MKIIASAVDECLPLFGFEHEFLLKNLTRKQPVTRSRKVLHAAPPTAYGQFLVQVHISTSSQVQDIWQNEKRLGLLIAEAM